MRNIIALFFSFTFIIVQSQSFDLNIKIKNIKQTKGTLELVVYNNANTFLEKGEAVKRYSILATSTIKSFTIKNLPKGSYAIAVYHDVNSDKRCNTNLVGIPVEPYGFSRNYKPVFSKPSFDDCMINIEKSMSIDIALL